MPCAQFLVIKMLIKSQSVECNDILRSTLTCKKSSPAAACNNPALFAQMMSQLESNVTSTNKVNLNLKSSINYQNRVLEAYKRFIGQLTYEKEQLRAQVIWGWRSAQYSKCLESRLLCVPFTDT